MWEFACLCWYPEYLSGGMEMRKSRDTKLNLTGKCFHRDAQIQFDHVANYESLCVFVYFYDESLCSPL